MVAYQTVQDTTTKMIREPNDYIKNDNRVEISMLRVGDGTTFCYKN
jgi:predicted O-methyltransferase YrrM